LLSIVEEGRRDREEDEEGRTEQVEERFIEGMTDEISLASSKKEGNNDSVKKKKR
jgi:hypothetical protein